MQQAHWSNCQQHAMSYVAAILARAVRFRMKRGLIRTSMNNKCMDAATWNIGGRVHMW
jgi:hypothetical protein